MAHGAEMVGVRRQRLGKLVGRLFGIFGGGRIQDDEDAMFRELL